MIFDKGPKDAGICAVGLDRVDHGNEITDTATGRGEGIKKLKVTTVVSACYIKGTKPYTG